MKTKFILFFLLFTCTIQAQTINLESSKYRYKHKEHDVALWSKWIYSYDDKVLIIWDYTHNTIEVKDNQDFTFDLIPLSPQQKTIIIAGNPVKRFYYSGKDWDNLNMSVTINDKGDHDYEVVIVRRHLIVKYWCKEVSKPYKN